MQSGPLPTSGPPVSLPLFACTSAPLEDGMLPDSFSHLLPRITA